MKYRVAVMWRILKFRHLAAPHFSGQNFEKMYTVTTKMAQKKLSDIFNILSVPEVLRWSKKRPKIIFLKSKF